jgi:signal transduction histidine kinase/CheY-like chemotaxis protein
MGTDLPLMAIRKDGTTFPVNVSLSPIHTDQGMHVAASVRDVTSRNERERKLLEAMEDLGRANRDLEETSQELEAQHEELQQTNRELEEQRSALEEEKQKLVSLARELRTSHAEVAEKAREAELANRHKSEFLANVSHELRTPLNSIMILSQVLVENADGDLSEEQMRHARTIHLSGKDLLELINDILDLAKIEAGRTDLHLTELPIAGVVENIERTFAMQMQEKSIAFHVYVDPKLPETIRSDQALVEQILKNLVSNALKFTERGSIAVRFEASDIGAQFCMSVTDTGIGIPVDQQQLIFEAFRQVDNSLSRRFGGTGLGLTISRNLARALGGSIDVDSAPGEGSTFTARLPLRHEAPTLPEETPQLLRARLTEREARFALHDDRDRITERDKTILVIEDDEKFAETVLEKCRRSGFSVLYAADGREGIELAKSFVPHAVILDLRLPEVGGIDVLGSLKGDSNTHHIPVHVMSVENRGEEVLKLGAAAFFEKPVSLENLDATIATIERMTARQAKNVLLVEDESADRSDIRELLDDGTIKVTTAHTVDQARTCLRSHHYDCIILNPTLNGECGVDVLKSFDGEAKNLPPVIVYAGRELTKPELSELEEYPDTIVIKGRDSNRRLLDELTLFLHSVDARRLSLPSPLPGVADNDSLAGKKVLIVDDDMRNVYSLRHVLLSRGLRTVEAHTGREALAALEAEPDVDIVLMDIMMPEMDGIEAIKAIRKISGFAKLPIIALTAKAMKRDREECLQAGADDYLSKPVDIAKLMSAMRVWLSE